MKRYTPAALLPLLVAVTTACGDSSPNTNAPSSSTGLVPNVFAAGRYEMLVTGGTLAGSCSGSTGTITGTNVPAGSAHVATVELRSEGSDWIATSTGAGDTLRVRFTFEDFPASSAFTGSMQGRAASLVASLPDLPALEVASARLSGSVLDPEQGMGAVRVFGTVAGQLQFTSGRGVVTCTGGNLILTRATGL